MLAIDVPAKRLAPIFTKLGELCWRFKLTGSDRLNFGGNGHRDTSIKRNVESWVVGKRLTAQHNVNQTLRATCSGQSAGTSDVHL
jgi:hypothetical protein